jgi:hypothetical protein
MRRPFESKVRTMSGQSHFHHTLSRLLLNFDGQLLTPMLFALGKEHVEVLNGVIL